MDEIAHLLSELDRLHHRQAELRSYERRLAECGENDPASDTWKTAAIVAASAEADFQSALVRNWNIIARLLKEGEQWRARESETQEALQAIGEEFGVRGGEPRVDGIRRVLVEQRDTISRVLREAVEGWRPISEAKKDGTTIWAKMRDDIYPALRPEREDLARWNGVQIPLRHPGLAENGFDIGWSVAAPVGSGGFPDEWIEAFQPLPPPPSEAATLSQETHHEDK